MQAMQTMDDTASFQAYKWKWFIVLIAYFCLGYLSLNHFNVHRESYVDVMMAFEPSIPFFPSAILGYLLVYLAALLPFLLINNKQHLNVALKAAFIMLTIHFVLFYVAPVRMTYRPDLENVPGIMNQFAFYYFKLDQPTNCFPSLHVAMPTLATWMTWKSHPKWRFSFVAMTVIIAISVVVVKQHYIADVVAGALVASAVGSFFFVRKKQRV